jgi:hypothetical protein
MQNGQMTAPCGCPSHLLQNERIAAPCGRSCNFLETIQTIQIIKDSVTTSVNLKLFKNIKDATMAHIFHSRLDKISIHEPMDNFNGLTRLSHEPYPKHDRPRGQSDVSSVNYHRKMIRSRGAVEQPIWVFSRGGQYTLLDGAHRLAATFLENKRRIPAFIIEL